MSFALPFTTPTTLEVFAVEDTTAQVTWRRLPPGELGVVAHHAGGVTQHVLGDAAEPGAADISGFAPGSATVIEVTIDDRPVAQRLVTTQPSLESPALTKFATISDLHLGEPGFGAVKKLREPSDRMPYPLRCAIAAAIEAQAWGAELLVIKGDITDLGYTEHWEQFDQLLDVIDVPVLAIPGNHDTVGKRASLDATEQLQARGLFPQPIQTHDLAGARLVLADSTIPGRGRGRIDHRRGGVLDAVRSDAPTMLFTHHHLEDRVVPWFWPPGVNRFDNQRFLAAVTAATPDLWISSGHTHRTRARREGTALLTEVGAPKDFPGVWAGYTLHEAGARQTVRRIAEPSCVAWNDRTHAVVGGIWGRWSPGSLNDRCVLHTWSTDRRTELVGTSTDHSASSGVSERA